MIDFHCHLDLYPSPAQIARQCAERRLYVLSVTTVPSAFEGTAALAPQGSRIRTALGLHPELAAKRAHELGKFEVLLSQTAYVGEVGLDGSGEHKTTLDIQRGVLLDILRMCARAGGRVITIHSRAATSKILDVLDRESDAGSFVLHWYLGSPRQIARAVEIGCWFSVGPAMLASARGLNAVLAMPKDRIIPESDGPFGTLQKRPLYPWEAASIVPVLADVWRQPEEQVRSQIATNFRRLVANRPSTRLGAAG